jgi:transcriptional regulator with XRE-family HTH domain
MTTEQVTARPKVGFPTMLRAWRRSRRLSQLGLALESGVSQRHISFLESGRAQPSRDMVRMLAEAFGASYRDQNAMLLAAGFAPAYAERDLSAPELGPVNLALDFMLRQMEPFPAIVVDRHWNQIKANGGAVRLLADLAGGALGPSPINLMRMFFDPAAFKPFIENWAEIAPQLLRDLHVRASADALDPKGSALIRSILAFPGVKEEWLRPAPGLPSMPVVPIKIRRGQFALSLFSTMTTLGTPQDVTLQELHLETFFPADEATEKTLRALAAG